MRIIIVEDDYFESDHLESLFLREFPGVEILKIETESAFQAAYPDFLTRPPDVVILDMLLPFSHNVGSPTDQHPDIYRAGLRCQQVLSGDPRTSNIPMVLYSVLDRADIRDVHLPSNVSYCLKSTDELNIVRHVRSLLAAQRKLPRKAVSLPVRDCVFVSYSHQDKRWLDEILLTLSPYLDAGEIDLWNDTMLDVGDLWRQKIDENLRRARVAVLLVSRHFLASPFIKDNELPPLLDAAERIGLRIFWIPVSASAYHKTTLNRYQAAASPTKPLDTLNPSERSRCLVKIADLLEKTFKAGLGH